MSHRLHRPSQDDYYMHIAWDVSLRGNCLRRAVGAIIVGEWGIMSNGYDGTPFGVKNCNEGGCPRCVSNSPRHQGYDSCLCIHAEQNVIILAARRGIATNNTRLYATQRPCLDCLKMILQAGIREIVYNLPFELNDKSEKTYQTLLTESGIAIRKYPSTTLLELFKFPSK